MGVDRLCVSQVRTIDATLLRCEWRRSVKKGRTTINHRTLNEPSSDMVRNEDSPRSNSNERLRKMPKHDEAGIVVLHIESMSQISQRLNVAYRAAGVYRCAFHTSTCAR